MSRRAGGQAGGLAVWLTAGLRLWRRVVRTRPALAVSIFAVTLVAAVLVAIGARLLDQVSAEDLVSDIEAAPPRAANIQFVSDGRFAVGPEGEPLARLAEQGQRIFDDDLPADVQEVISDQQFVLESPPFRVSSYPDQNDGPFTRSLRFRFQSELAEHLTVVEGREPAERELRSVLLGPDCPPDMSAVDEFEADSIPEDLECRVGDIPVYEVAVTAQTASDLLVELGDTVVLRPDLTHLRWAFIRADLLDRLMLVEIVGIVELTDSSDPYWFGDDVLHRPTIVENPDFRFIFASAVTPPSEFRPMVRDVQDVHFDAAWKYKVEPELINQTEAADLAAEIDKLGSNEDEVVTQLPEIIDQHLVERTLTVALMSTAFAGVLVVSAAAAFVLASLAADRQRHSMRWLLDRGIGRGGLRWTGVWHGLVVAVPAVAVALVLAALAVDDARWSRPVVASTLIVLSVAGSVAAAVWLAANRAARGTVSGPRSVPRTGTFEDLVGTETQVAAARRIVRDGALLVAAVGAVVLVRRRAEFGSADSGVDLDLLMAVAPPLLGLAAGVVALRVMAPLYRSVASLGRRLRGLLAFVGFRRLLNQGRAARSAAVIVVLAVGMAGFALATRGAVLDAQRLNGWQLVGADLALRGQALDSPVPPAVIDEVREQAEPVVAASQQPSTPVVAPADLPAVELLAVEVDRYRSLLADAPIDSSTLDALADADVGADGGADGDVLPAVITRSWAPAERPTLGDQIELLVESTRVTVEVVDVVDEFPAVPVGRPAVIVDLDALRPQGPGGFVPTTVLFVAAERDAAGSLVGSLNELDPTLRIADRYEHGRSLAIDPFVRWTDIGLRLLAGFATTLAALSVLSTLALGASTRKRDLGLLATMGLDSRQAAMVTTIEQLVPTMVAALAGAIVAAGLARLIPPALNLSAFAGGPLPVDDVAFGSVAAVVALMGPAMVVLGVVLAAVLLSTWALSGWRRRSGDAGGVTTLSMGEI